MFYLEGVSKLYRRSDQTVTALDTASFEVEDGEFVAIVGPSGSGKSTLLAILGAMLTPTAGVVRFENRSLFDLSVPERAEIRRLRMGFVFQTFNLVPYLTAVENVEIPLLLRGDSKKQQRARAMALLEQMGLVDRGHHKPSELSTGQQQRVALARTMANDPACVFADEPTGNLDPATRNNVLGFLDTLHKSGKTIVLVTHDHQVAQRADRVLRMDTGRIYEENAVALRVSA